MRKRERLGAVLVAGFGTAAVIAVGHQTISRATYALLDYCPHISGSVPAAKTGFCHTSFLGGIEQDLQTHPALYTELSLGAAAIAGIFTAGKNMSIVAVDYCIDHSVRAVESGED